VSKTVWIILTMGVITILALTMGMVVSLGQFQEVPAAEWVKVAAMVAEQFKFENVNARVQMRSEGPSALKISYITKPSPSFDSSAQNVEMENVAKYAIENYKGKDVTKIDQVEINRSEIHGRGCFQTTYVATFTMPNPKVKSVGDQFRQR
jgi:hypothetical protein